VWYSIKFILVGKSCQDETVCQRIRHCDCTATSNDGVSGCAMGWGLWLDCEYKLTECVGQLWDEAWDWTVNKNRRSEWKSCVVKFVIGLWIQTDGVGGTADCWGYWFCCEYRVMEWVWERWGEVSDWFVNINRRSGTAVWWALWLGCEYRLTEWVGRLWGEVCDGALNTNRRSDWGSCGVRFMIGLWIRINRVSGTVMGWGLWLGCEY
jgi:hypothetical protein